MSYLLQKTVTNTKFTSIVLIFRFLTKYSFKFDNTNLYTIKKQIQIIAMRETFQWYRRRKTRATYETLMLQTISTAYLSGRQGGRTILPASAGFPTSRLCCYGGWETWILNQTSLASCYKRTSKLEIAGHFQLAAGNLSLDLAGEARFLLAPWGPRAGETNGTSSTRPSSTILEIRNPALDDV